MGLLKGLFKGIGTKANDAYTKKQVDKSAEKSYKKTGKILAKATKRGEYLGKKKSRELFIINKTKNEEKAKTNGKARDRFLDGL